MTTTHVRHMIRRDLPAVLQIEEEGFEFPWSESDFVRCLRQRNCIGMVAEWDNEPLGFMIYEIHHHRLHLLNFAVAEDSRRFGIGSAMVYRLLDKLSADRRNRIMIEVRDSNLNAQLFFKAMGFKAISVLRDFYDDPAADAYLMQFRYSPTSKQEVNRISKAVG